jgi:hypothetical protein
VLSKDQLAQRRGRDQGDDVLVSGNDAGDLGIVSSNAGTRLYCTRYTS